MKNVLPQLGCDHHDPTCTPPSGTTPNHLGSSSYITNLGGEITQHMEYLPFGETLIEEHLNSNNSPYKFNAKEYDAETGNYYYSARYYSPKYNLMLSVDQMYDLYPSFSPYAYTLQNPVRYVDPTGMTAEPPAEGIPQYLDDTGTYFWNEEKGQYWHSESNAYYRVTSERQSVGDATYIFNGEYGIQGGVTLTPDRPDYDGFVSVTEGVEWALKHPNALDNPTPENSLFIATSKSDFGNLSVSDFNTVGEFEPQNLLNAGNFAASAGNEKLRGTVYALGRVNMRLNNKATRNVSIMNDKIGRAHV